MIGPSPSPSAPGSQVNNGDERLVVLNAVARSVIEARRGHGGAYVFTCKGKPVSRMMTSAWKRARIRTGLPQVRVHEGADPDCYTVNARLAANQRAEIDADLNAAFAAVHCAP